MRGATILPRQLADGEAPLAASQAQLERALRVRAQIEAELQAARIASDELDALLRDRDAARSSGASSGSNAARVEPGRGAAGRAAGPRAARERRRAVGRDATSNSPP